MKIIVGHIVPSQKTPFLIVYTHLQELQVNRPSEIAELWLANSLEKYEISFRK